MELDELKRKWTEYDKKLNENLKLNENVLRKMNLDKSRNKIRKHIILEVINIGIQFPMAIFLSYISIQLLNEPEFSIPGFIALLLLLYSIISSAIKTNVFLKMDYYNFPITELQKQLTDLKTTFLWFRKIELIFLPLLIVSIIPILLKSLAGINVYENLFVLLSGVALLLVFSYSVAYFSNCSLNRRLKESKMYLKEIENFKKEG